jgi:thiamine kinase-like enzyme
MDVSEMLEREDLPAILRDTVELFCRDLLHTQIFISLKPSEQAESMYLLSRPGILSKRRICKQAYETIMSEYSLRGNPLKFIAARGYILSRIWFMDRVSVAKLYISGKDKKILDNTLIVPNNKSIRVFDYDSDSVYSIVKQGFATNFIENQIVFRKTHDYPFILPMIACGEGWFQERILHGHALARVRDKVGYQDSLEQAVCNIQIMFNDSCQEIAKEEYFEQLNQNIKQLLKRIGVSTIAAEKIMDFANWLCPTRGNMTGMMKIGLSHGDFQPGNIWRDNDGKTWIYDWETVGIRSAWYDMAIMFNGLRSGKKYKDFLKESLNWDIGNEIADDIKKIIVMEDLIFQLNEALVFQSDYRNLLIEQIWNCKCSEYEGTN